jgi:hypothetical protein
MTLEELKQSIKDQLEQADKTVIEAQAVFRQAEINQAFLRGQLHALNQIVIERPVYTDGQEPV